jgi:hypothetical protein
MSSQTVFGVLQTRPDGKNRLNDLDRIKDRASKLLPQILKTFPDYTDHGITHSERLINIFDYLIPDSLKETSQRIRSVFLIGECLSARYWDAGFFRRNRT